MYSQYGPVPLRVIDLVRFEREAVWTEDKADLLFVKNTLGMVATYAPGGVPQMISVTAMSPDTTARLTGADTTAAVLGANPRGAPPGATAAVLPAPALEPFGPTAAPLGSQRTGAETDAELFQRLMIPRQKFILWAYDRQTGAAIRWLESPRVGFAVDADNGPRPLSCDVISASGEPHSAVVLYQIETSLPPCPTGSDRFVLSHRWKVSHTHDADYYLTRVTEGTIVFHPGVRDLLGVHPDRVRNQFIHPIPLGFKRGLPLIEQSSDGCTIRYTITDTDPTIVFAPGVSGATQISIEEKFQYAVPPLAGILPSAPGVPIGPPGV